MSFAVFLLKRFSAIRKPKCLCFIWFDRAHAMVEHLCPRCGLNPDRTQAGRLPPWEVAKALAFRTVIDSVCAHLDQKAPDLLGKPVDTYIAEQLILVGGGQPTERAVRALVSRSRSSPYYPGQPRKLGAGRPAVFTEHQKNEVARVAMHLKSGKRPMQPSPARVRAVLPRLIVNPETDQRMSDWSIREIFKTRCYDEDEEDMWQWLPAGAQTYLTPTAIEQRMRCATYIVKNFPTGSWVSHVAIDPCSTLLPRADWRLLEMQVAAMGKHRWRSRKATRLGANLRAAATALKQSGSCLQVHWTPVFARGSICIYVCDPAATGDDAPKKLNDSCSLGMFVRRVLPGILSNMKARHGWSSVPRVVVHDKASYMVNSAGELLHPVFCGALKEAGMTSWTGPPGSSTSWLCGKFSDVYLHETAISHIRRLLAMRFVCDRVDETFPQFRTRMQKVEDFMNSEDFSAEHGGKGLPGLAKDLVSRCRTLAVDGERLPK